MIEKIRTSKASKVVACYLALMIILEITAPMQAYALTEGASQPEFNSFTQIGTSDMVSLTSGDFNYNIPIMDVGGYPINLAYDSGITMDQEASWVGLGWNLNVGQINRQVRGLPDDFKGDEMNITNNIRKNITIGVNPYFNAQVIGALDTPGNLGAGLNVQYNNYTGLSAVPSFGLSFNLSNSVSVGMQLTGSAEDGATITPNVGISLDKTLKGADGMINKMSLSVSPSISYNSRQGLQYFNLSSSFSNTFSKGENSFKGTSGGRGSISFINNTFTPSKRLAFDNTSITLSFSTGIDVMGFHGEGSISASATVQSLKNPYQIDKAYGYDFTQYASTSDMLDFNREKEQSTVTKNTLILPVTNYTYDIYSIQSQGLGGQFRPSRSQTGYVFDSKVVDGSSSQSFGLEAEAGWGGHLGLNFKTNETNTYTGNWETNVQSYFNDNVGSNAIDYEKVYHKMVGEQKTDDDGYNLLVNKFAGNTPITLALGAGDQPANKFAKKTIQSNSYESTLTAMSPFTSPLKRTKRERRNTVIQKVSAIEANNYNLKQTTSYGDRLVHVNDHAKPHHTAAYIVTDENGNRHVFGETAYNITKEEVSFATGGHSFNEEDGTVNYVGNPTNHEGVDHYYNKTVTPAYAHTYMISHILSSDYEDVTGDGTTDDDMGSYTKFEYVDMGDYKWRTPYGYNTSSYNEGLKTLKGAKGDQKGSYVYGEKESKYLSRIVTKTHVAFVDLQLRNDGYGVNGPSGGGDATTSSRMYSIKSIRLYSKPEVTDASGNIVDPATQTGSTITPIKTAFFEYDYSLCGSVENNISGGGKLTLKKVYFTYRGSNMGKYTPYHFNYKSSNNFSYRLKDYDVWGNYKPLTSDASFTDNNAKPSPQEFPYVNQSSTEVESGYSDKREQQDEYASAWALSSIDLPSGGKIDLTYETDDYKYVQNKRALQMFKVEGVSSSPTLSSMNSFGSNLYSGTSDAKYVVVKLDADDTDTNINNFRQRYLGDIEDQPIYFSFLLNMTNSDYEYVEGYFEIDTETVNVQPEFITSGSNKYIFIPMKLVDREGKSGSGVKSNPVSVAGWFFGRENLNRQVNGVSMDPSDSFNLIDLAHDLVNNLGAMIQIFQGGNQRLKERGCAKVFKKQKSWIRLQEPTGTKMGGGCRVKKIIMHDAWETMTSTSGERYSKEYGQSYDYTLEDGTSSGVATYEPNACKENPFIKPFYNKPEKLSAKTYSEEPFGESFFPAPTVTYSRVSVKNITAADDDSGTETSKTKTGKVVTQHYTSYDFPTITDFTTLDSNLAKSYNSNEDEAIGNMLKGLLGLKVETKTNLTMTQGFTIEVNDMNGKLKKQEVFNNGGSIISSVEYKYNTETDAQGNSTGKLSSVVPVINEKGEVDEKTIGLEYDVVTDFRESYANTKSFGVSGNVDMIPALFIPIIVGFGVPERAEHTQRLRTAVTTKVINRTGILKEVIAFDLGSRVTTKNMAWEASTGSVLLTETINEFDDKYYSFNYPAYWYYNQLGHAADNIDIKGKLIGYSGNYFRIQHNGTNLTNIDRYIKIGDELQVLGASLWVSGYYPSATNPYGVKLMQRNGTTLTSGALGNNNVFRLLRSGKRNQQNASMASVTSMVNPIRNTSGQLTDITSSTFVYLSPASTKRVLNASAIMYSDIWDPQCECDLPRNVNYATTPPTYTYDETGAPFNPFIYNIKNEWRPVKSYAYLTGRDITDINNPNTRNTGFYDKFESTFYEYNSSQQKWVIDTAYTNYKSWTFASKVTKYSPKGAEIENGDALNRYSSAQYGHNYTLPIAVATNSRYQDMGYQSFEDFTTTTFNNPVHFGFSNSSVPSYSGIVSIVNNQSHTGEKSLHLLSGGYGQITYDGDKNVVDVRKTCKSFKPTSQEYVVSAWVKQTGIAKPKTYDGPKINIISKQNGTVIDQYLFSASGPIIDGWQRVEGTFRFNPNQSTSATLDLILRNTGTTDVYFDDLRVHPKNSSMKSFAYDDETQRLMAELDENNYATFYEYDKEGSLIRIKKETEQGVYTIQESRSGNPKKQYTN